MKKISQENKNMKVAYVYGFISIILLVILTVASEISKYKVYEAIAIGIAISLLVFGIANMSVSEPRETMTNFIDGTNNDK